MLCFRVNAKLNSRRFPLSLDGNIPNFAKSRETHLTSIESALTRDTPITRLESALTKSLDLKSFRIRTYKKGGGGGVLLGAGLCQLYESEEGLIDRSGDAEGGTATGDIAV